MHSDKFEQLSPDNLTEKLKKRQEELNILLTKKLRTIKNAPEGNLRIAQAHQGKKIQYFHITKSGDTKGTYIPHNQHMLAKRLAQKQYDKKLIKVLRGQIAALGKFIAKSEKQIEKLYKELCPSRRKLVTPASLPDEDYIELWESVHWEGHPFSPEQNTYTTARGEVVRSKSEVIIADTLARHKIPYRYEFPLTLKNGNTIHPDFLCLNVRSRKEFYLEHFGLMDSPDYMEATLQKLKAYNENGILPGKNLLFTMESASCPLNTRQVENLIREFLA